MEAASTASTPGFQGPGEPYVQYVRSDGFQLVAPGASTITINGVRAYDSSLGAWTTPDAYHGDVHDPASQQRYMFNRGNAYDYSDPSGYDPFDLHLGFNGPIFVTPTSTRNLNTQGLPFSETGAKNGAEHGRIVGGSIVAVGTLAVKPTGPVGAVATVVGGAVAQAGGEAIGSKVGYVLGGYLSAPPVSATEQKAYDALNVVAAVGTLRGLPEVGKGMLAKGAAKANAALSKAAGIPVSIK